MIIFRIIGNLVRLVTRLAFSILWLPVFILTRHVFVIILVIGVIIFFALKDDNGGGDRASNSRKGNPVTMVRDAKGNLVQVSTPVSRIEDGDSAFANDIYKQMTDQERTYYSQIYFWAMSNLPDGQGHSWSQLDIAGTITPSQSFTNKTGERCRRFSEVLKVHAVQQNITGLACAKRDGTWCKLKANATPACGLGRNPGMLDGLSDSLKNIF